ncbi:MAG TPA: hypothetical protein VKZ41_08070 [Gemmatimonadales bacterium]|nr:hypothetical protein [Gemmatimonadales bacterium]
MQHSTASTPPTYSASPDKRPTRAPAVYCRLRSADGGLSFRIPCPPCWDGKAPSGWAAERRARRAYFAALDALHTGKEVESERSKLGRFVDEMRNTRIRGQLEHLVRVLDFSLRRHTVTTVDKPDRPFNRVELTVPVPPGAEGSGQLEERFRWTLEWLQTRGYTAGRDLRIDWRVQLVRNLSWRTSSHPQSGSGRRASAQG